MQSRWIGQTLGDRYRIEEILGQGGMSSVYKAYDPNVERYVAIKIIHSHLSRQPGFVERFGREAAAVGKLRHPNIIQVYDSNHDGGTYYIVFEYIEGKTLRDKLEGNDQNNQRMPIPKAIDIAASLGDALGYAHAQGMIHRDIKPANIMLTKKDDPVLMDFGIVKIVDSANHTATGVTLGTVQYMSPEQIKGEPIDTYTDIYALGITLFEILGGRTPFQADSTMAVMMMHVQAQVPDLHNLRQGISPDLIAIIKKSLAKDPADRFKTGAEFSRALRSVRLNSSSVEPTLIDMPPAFDIHRTIVERSQAEPTPPPQDSTVVVPIAKRQPPTPIVQPSQPQTEPARSKKKWIIPVVLLLMLTTAAIYFTFFRPPNIVESTPSFLTPAAIVTDILTPSQEPTIILTPTETPMPLPTSTSTPTPTSIPVTPTPAYREVVNIPNGNFEQGFANWDSTGNATLTDDGYNGQGIEINHVSGGNSDIKRILSTPLEGGKVYQITAWCKAEAGAKCKMFFGRTEDLSVPPDQTKDSLAGNGDWQRLSVTVILSQDEQMHVFLYSEVAGYSVTYDEVQIEEVSCDTICNGGFEENFDFWESAENADITVNGRSGQGIRVNYDAENADIWQQLPGIFEAGKTYRATVWCKAVVGDDCKMFFGDADESFNPPDYENVAKDLIVGTGDWQELSATLTLTKDEQMYVYLYSGVPGSSAVYDDISIEEVTSP